MADIDKFKSETFQGPRHLRTMFYRNRKAILAFTIIFFLTIYIHIKLGNFVSLTIEVEDDVDSKDNEIKDPVPQNAVESFLRAKVAFAMKTGADVAGNRLFAVRKAWLDRTPNHIFIADRDFQTTDGINVTNVISTAKEIMKKKAEAEINEEEHEMKRRSGRNVDPIMETTGWKNDKHKNLPGFRALYKAYPDAEWYIMVDDDTYIFLHNLVYMLSHYDSSQALYLGKTMSYSGCGAPVDGFDENFKQGGAGIILSRAAMIKMMEIVEDCIWESRDCWAGDVRVAICLQHADIGPTDNSDYIFSDVAWPNINKDSTWMMDSPCSIVVSNHKLAPQTLLNLREMERRISLTGQHFNYGEIYGYKYLSNTAILKDDIYGTYGITKDREIIGAALKEEVMTGSDLDCKRLCEITPDCRAWTRSKSSMCSMKKNIKEWSMREGFSSGLPYKCF